MGKIIYQMIAGILGIFLAEQFLEGVAVKIIPGESDIFGYEITAIWQMVAIIGIFLGLLNFFVKPVLKFITTPLRMLTFGLFTIVINMLMVWIADLLFLELIIDGLTPLFWTAAILWVLNFFLLMLYKKRERKKI
jgi:putative membrane protein